MKTKEELIEQLSAFEEAFNEDKEVKALMGKLKERFETLESQFFTGEDFGLEEFGDMAEEYYSSLRENDPDDASLFQVLWFD
jgi:hypothetical protein